MEAFVERMNARAKELGLAETHFVNPHGLDDPAHLSGAEAFEAVFAFDFDTYINKKGFTGAGNLICPRCIAGDGGRSTAARHKEQLSEWGRQGGRGRKKGSRWLNDDCLGVKIWDG